MDVTDRKSSKTGRPPFRDESHEVEKIELPNALDKPAEGRVNEPDLRRLLRSVRADEAAEDATEVE